jgi:PIN domain nuclease of toxin-antitoxin system
VKVLLDTHVLLWSIDEPERIGPEARIAFRDDITETVVSVVTLWEIAIKQAAGRLRAPQNMPDRVRALGHEILPISVEHAWRVGVLPMHHRDPFDRLLVAQAMIEDLAIVTHDHAMPSYGVRIIRA